jgi:FtsH-binding integral membrane protein
VSAAGRALWLGLAGLVLGPLAWAVSIEFGTFAPALFCRPGPRWGVWIVALALLVALAGAVLSWRGHAALQGPVRFAAALGMLLALLLVLPLGLQLLAALVLSGCEA